MVYTHVLNRGGRGVRSPLDGVGVSATSRRESLREGALLRPVSAP